MHCAIYTNTTAAKSAVRTRGMKKTRRNISADKIRFLFIWQNGEDVKEQMQSIQAQQRGTLMLPILTMYSDGRQPSNH